MSSYIKVRKEVARTFYNKGFDIRIIPCKVSEQVLYDKNMLISPVIINKKNSKEKENSFDRIINSYIYYNCQNAELGYYPHYFVEESIYNSYRKEMKQ